MIVELGFPVVIRAMPPRCVSQKQVICVAETMASLHPVEESLFPVVADMRHADGTSEQVRHNGSSFYRRVCTAEEGRTVFPAMLKSQLYLRDLYRPLMDDGRNSGLEASELTWPPKETRRGNARKHVTFADALGFEMVDRGDVLGCEAGISRLKSMLRLQDDAIWIRCGEPCYRLVGGNKTQATLSFADQDTGSDVKEAFVSATSLEHLHELWKDVANEKDRRRGIDGVHIEIADASVFTKDFDDAAFMKYARMVARGLSYHFCGGWSDDGGRIMEADLEELAMFVRLRATIQDMEQAGTATALDETLVLESARVWRRHGGAYRWANRYASAEEVAAWSGRGVERWSDRSIDVDRIMLRRRERHPTPGAGR